MSDVDAIFCRRLLKATYDDVSAALKARGFNRWQASRMSKIRNVASVTDTTIGGRKTWHVHIVLRDNVDLGDIVEEFHWDGRAHNAHEARAKGWLAWLDKIAA